MFQLKTGYFLSGIITGLILLFSFIRSLPDGKLTVVFCDVGQGDGAYIRFPNGRDMIVDGGPSENSMVGCLGRVMPFWDRHIDMVMMTHPQKDHMQGLIGVVGRYKIDYFIQSDIHNTTEGYNALVSLLTTHKVKKMFVTTGESIAVGDARINLLWPTRQQIDVLGADSTIDLNDGSLVFWLTYGQTNILFTGDADTRVSDGFVGTVLPDEKIEVLKVPHHGSKTGMDTEFLEWVRPEYAVISVGKNTYGHPTQEAIDMLNRYGVTLFRTDKEKDIRFVSDGSGVERY